MCYTIISMCYIVICAPSNVLYQDIMTKWHRSFKACETKLHSLNQASFDSQCRLKTLKKYRCAQKVIMVAFETTSISDLTYMLTVTKRSCSHRIQRVLTNVSTTRVNKTSEYRHKKIKVTSDFQWELEAKLWSEEWSMFKLDTVPLESVTPRFNKELRHQLEKLIRANLIQGQCMLNSILRPPYNGSQTHQYYSLA